MAKQKVGILSYQALHRKTNDLIFRLKAMGYTDVTVYALPFHYKKTFAPIYEHRPSVRKEDALWDIGYEKLINNLGYTVINVESVENIDASDTVFIIAGAGILLDSFIKSHIVINAHPGYIPNARGLDALKWAIVEKEPIGVTTHMIGDYVDAGDVIERRQVEIYPNDTFYQLAMRQYELEVEMLVDAIKKYRQIEFTTDGEGYPVHKRMPKEIEKELLDKFEQYKKGRG